METLSLCVSCKACRRECPTSVDMARMKIEAQAARAANRGFTLHQRLIGWLPRYASYPAKVPWLFNVRNAVPALRWLSEAVADFSARRALPRWRRDIFTEPLASVGPEDGREVVLFTDTFNRFFERENVEAAVKVLLAGGCRVHFARPAGEKERPLCCGRTFLASGAVEQALEEAQRTLAALAPYVLRGVPVIGLEPSCLLTFRDEMPALLKNDEAKRLSDNSFMFEEFLAREHKEKRLNLPLKPLGRKAMLHGHCHQKAFAAMGGVEATLKLVPDLQVDTIESSCCGMAGSFGYAADTIDVSLAMGELSLLPAVRGAPADALIVADGTSCRHQIHDGAGREAVHVARVLAMALDGGAPVPP